MEKPAGLATFQYTEKELPPLRTCARCCFSFPCRSWFPGSAEPSQAPLSHPPTAHSMHHAQLCTDISISVIAERSGKKNPKQKIKNQTSNNNNKSNQQINLLYFQLFPPCLESVLDYCFVSSLHASDRPHAFVFPPTVYLLKVLLPVSCCFLNFVLYLSVCTLQRPGAWRKP